MKKSEVIRRTIGLVLLGFLISLGFFKPVHEYLAIPHHLTIFSQETSSLASQLPTATHVTSQNPKVITVSGQTKGTLHGKQTGQTDMMVSVGHIPVKKVGVNVVPDIRLVPGGESIGIKLNSVGVLVVGYHLVDTKAGEKSPGEEAGVKVGDIITKINGETIEKMADVKNAINDAEGKALKLVVVRSDGGQKTLTLQPLKDQNDQKYRIGLYIRDSAAGIGTMSFYDPRSGKYGALGHVISDIDTKEPIRVHNGQIVNSQVSAIDKGKDGHPGEKIASFPSDEKPIGSVDKNTPFGIFGKLNQDISNGMFEKGLPIALEDEVKEGPAKILTVVNGSKVEAYDVKILNSVKQDFPATKGLVIKVTDPELLNKTGGIVQGMSGSPIIQNGKLIGAVTHVFVNDPTSGYGCHIEWMLKEAGIDIYNDQHEKKKAS
ncbi:stage IV sporulation protein B [Pullulanibacillus pueri]|uniref:SpoIVB peptidase n=1 Tax=Pullulanibacillus pueri TaxID=1437324 RepID=A0A8J2ZVD3_9BACL|nr:SpoIVB peptidase [Pullulanibacillus pueri]MBM7681603.1 stage IV sporulation protein B [Pullulanibacillus pueri]GGH79494.1 SpoIVB peptidase [Pullulanibacillus pueri]